jgi:triacylglycerol esterase/lipase EstA (alpha/beta hydrolase family)
MSRVLRFARRLLVPGVAAAAAVLLGVAQAPPAAAASAPLPVNYNFLAGIAAARANPSASPPGANNWSCRPSAQHPDPVVLVNGTGENMADGFSALSPLLVNNGYCVFAANFGGSPGNLLQGLGDIAQSAAELAAFVNQVLAAAGAAQVDLVGHSQGGMMPRYYIKFLGGAARVHTLVGLAPSNHGTTLDGLTSLLQTLGTLLPGVPAAITSACPACTEQIAGSAFLNNLNAGGDTVAGPTYTVIETKYDEVVTPYTSAFLSGSSVTNITLQNQCALDFADHLAVIYDPVALNDVLNALNPSHQIPVGCTLVLPVLGG